MKATRSLVMAAVAAAGLAVGMTAQAATHMGGHSGGGHSGGWHAGGWHGGGNWHGGSGWHGGGNWHGGWHNHVFFGGPRASFWWGWPLAFGPWYWWGYPYDYYYGSYYYPAYPAAEPYPQGVMPAPESDSAPPVSAPGAPTQGPTYMNYCESSKAYFPKVTTCPEGWKFVPAQPR